jgi:hypothetical protein
MRIFQGSITVLCALFFVSCSSWLFPRFTVEGDSIPASAISVSMSQITVSFSEKPSNSSLEAAFVLTENDTVKKGRLYFSGKDVSFVPTGGFSANKDYVLKISTDAESEAGVSLEKEYVRSFSSKNEKGEPLVEAVSPANGTVIGADPRQVIFSFSEPIDEESFKSAFGMVPSVAHLYRFDNGGKTAVVLLSESLSRGTLYSITLDTKLTDTSGNSLRVPYKSVFTFDDDTVPPRHELLYCDESGAFVAVSDGGTAHGIPDTTRFRISFDSEVDIATVQNYLRVIPSVAYEVKPDRESRKSADIILSSSLVWGTTYSITVKEGIADLAGNKEPLASKYTLVCDAEHDRPVSIFRGYFDRLASSPPTVGRYALLSEKTAFSDLLLDVSLFPTTGAAVATHAFFVIGISGDAGDIQQSSAFKAFSVSDTNSCADISIRSLRSFPLTDPAVPAEIQTSVMSDAELSSFPGKIRIIELDLDVENSASRGLVYFRVSKDLGDNLGNVPSAAWEAVLNKY